MIAAHSADHRQIDDFLIDGNTATGVATFYEQASWSAYFAGAADTYRIAQGTFEATCFS